MPSSNLIDTAARIFGGSAISSLGFSFGRDLYAKGKKAKEELLLWIILLFAGLGAYTAGVWATRNYRTFWQGFGFRLGALAILVPSILVLAFAFLLFFGDIAQTVLTGENGAENSSQSIPALDGSNIVPAFTSDGLPVAAPIENSEEPSSKELSIALLLLALAVPSFIFGVGCIVGLVQRKKRRLVWEAEEANKRFLAEHKLIQNEDQTIDDLESGQRYRIDHWGKQRITLFPVGRRGKRAFISIDPTGKFSEFTGMIHV